MRLRYTRPALADLDQVLTYISSHSPQGAARVRQRIHTATDLLASHPHIGTRTNDPKIRRLVARPYPYLIFYEVAGTEVIIHAVRHAARDPSEMSGPL